MKNKKEDINDERINTGVEKQEEPKPSIQNPTSEEEPRSEESNSEEEELQSRRGFFKRVAKTVLPVIGGLILSQFPFRAFASGQSCANCWYSCSSGCSSCTGSCQFGCRTSCSSCTGSCQFGCKGSCTSCTGSCQFGSSGSCSRDG